MYTFILDLTTDVCMNKYTIKITELFQVKISLWVSSENHIHSYPRSEYFESDKESIIV